MRRPAKRNAPGGSEAFVESGQLANPKHKTQPREFQGFGNRRPAKQRPPRWPKPAGADANPIASLFTR